MPGPGRRDDKPNTPKRDDHTLSPGKGVKPPKDGGTGKGPRSK